MIGVNERGSVRELGDLVEREHGESFVRTALALYLSPTSRDTITWPPTEGKCTDQPPTTKSFPLLRRLEHPCTPRMTCIQSPSLINLGLACVDDQLEGRDNVVWQRR